MSKAKSKKQFKNKKKKLMKKTEKNALPFLSKRDVSSNWLNFIKSSGLKDKVLFTRKSSCTEKEKFIERKSKPPIITKVVSLDCEMVADLSDENMLARVSIVNFKLECVYDKYVKPTSKVGDYRTRFSGVREGDLNNGADFEIVREEVRNILHNKILVGHALHNDFKVLKFGHHRQLIRDTSNYQPFKEASGTASPSLRKLAKVFLNENIQDGEHNSIEDAKTAMKLYKKFRREWEMFFVKCKSTQQSDGQNVVPI